MTTPAPSNDARALRRAALRRTTLHLVFGVVALDAIAMGAYYFGGIAQRASRTQTIFTVVWTVATALTVAVLLKRVRAVRRM
jgi:hypothetical protein